MSSEKIKKMLEVRVSLKKKKPEFLRQDSHKKVKLGSKWRKPKGLQSKMRLHKGGYRRSVTPGWKSPVMVRGLSRAGLREVVVNNVEEIRKVDPKTQAAVIASSVGNMKKVQMLKIAMESKIIVSNVKAPEEFIKKAEEKIAKKREEKKKAMTEKEKKSKEKEKLAKKKEEDKQKETKEKDKKGDSDSIENLVEAEKEKKEKEKKEKDKILITKE